MNSQGMEDYGRVIAEARAAKGLTQEDAVRGYEEACGERISTQQLSKWETGKMVPAAGRAVGYAQYLGVSLEAALFAWGLSHYHRS